MAYFQHFSVTLQSHSCPSEAEEKYKLVERKLKDDNEKKLAKHVKQNPRFTLLIPMG